jgi:hypothetical protein
MDGPGFGTLQGRRYKLLIKLWMNFTAEWQNRFEIFQVILNFLTDGQKISVITQQSRIIPSWRVIIKES